MGPVRCPLSVGFYRIFKRALRGARAPCLRSAMDNVCPDLPRGRRSAPPPKCARQPGARRFPHAEGSCLVRFGDTHVLCTASLDEKRAALAARRRQGLGHRRIRHAAARHQRAHAARGGGRQAVRPHAGDPAPDRPVAARRGRPAGARRAPDRGRLRRASRPMAARAPRRSPAPGWRSAIASSGCAPATW